MLDSELVLSDHERLLKARESFVNQRLLKVVNPDEVVRVTSFNTISFVVLLYKLHVSDVGGLAAFLVANAVVEGRDKSIALQQPPELAEC
jgi:hypothetical protein